MLSPLEQLLRPAVAAALPPGQDLRTGPAAAPDGTASRVAIHALRLVRDAPSGPDDLATRDAAFLGWQGGLIATPGHPLDFTLPADAVGDLDGVFVNTGHEVVKIDPLRRGADDLRRVARAKGSPPRRPHARAPFTCILIKGEASSRRPRTTRPGSPWNGPHGPPRS